MRRWTLYRWLHFGCWKSEGCARSGDFEPFSADVIMFTYCVFMSDARVLPLFSPMKPIHLLPLFALLASPSAWGVISLGGSTSEWTAIGYPATSRSDYDADQQTGHVASDIIGDVAGNQVAFYTQYDDNGTTADLDDDWLGFRVRMSAADGGQTPSWDAKLLIGIDVGGEGAADIFVITSQATSGAFINYYSVDNPNEPFANTSPSTTSITQITSGGGAGAVWTRDPIAPYFDYSAVDATTDAYFASGAPGASDNLDGRARNNVDETDYFVSFQVDVLTLIDAVSMSTGAVLDAAAGLRFLVGTSLQANAFNQDLNGQNGAKVSAGGDGAPTQGDNALLSWGDLGAATDVYTASGEVPEPATYALLFGLVGLGAVVVRRR